MITFQTEQEMIDFGEKLATYMFPNFISVSYTHLDVYKRQVIFVP